MFADVTQGVDFISTTVTGELRSRLFTAAKQIILVDGDGLHHVILQGARLLVFDYLELEFWSLDQMLATTELQAHYNYARTHFNDGEEPDTVTDDIRIPPLRAERLSNELPF